MASQDIEGLGSKLNASFGHHAAEESDDCDYEEDGSPISRSCDSPEERVPTADVAALEEAVPSLNASIEVEVVAEAVAAATHVAEAAEAADAGAEELAVAAEAVDVAAEEILPLEQWKEQAHAILQAQAIQGEAAPTLLPAAAAPDMEGGSSSGGVATPQAQPLPFVRPSSPLKDRFNYLTSDAGAKVLAKSDGMKNAGHILDNDRDRYMMTERDVKKKSVTLALIEDILLDTIVIANFGTSSIDFPTFLTIAHRIAHQMSRPPCCSMHLQSTIRAPSASCRSSARLPIRADSGRCSESLTLATRVLSKSSTCDSQCGRGT